MGPGPKSKPQAYPWDAAVFSDPATPALPSLLLGSPFYLNGQLLLAPTEPHKCTQTPLYPSKQNPACVPLFFLSGESDMHPAWCVPPHSTGTLLCPLDCRQGRVTVTPPRACAYYRVSAQEVFGEPPCLTRPVPGPSLGLAREFSHLQHPTADPFLPQGAARARAVSPGWDLVLVVLPSRRSEGLLTSSFCSSVSSPVIWDWSCIHLTLCFCVLKYQCRMLCAQCLARRRCSVKRHSL